MATPTQIRDALGVYLERIPKLVVDETLVAIQTLGDGGGAVVGGPTADYTGAMGKGLVTWTFPIYVLAPTADYAAATRTLDELVAYTGPRSVPNLIWTYGREQTGGLGVLDANGRPDLDAHIDALTAYGVEFANAGIDHIGAVLSCVVHTSGGPS